VFFFCFFGWGDHETKHMEDASERCYCCAFIHTYIYVIICLYVLIWVWVDHRYGGLKKQIWDIAWDI
jgi:hypothetical protein